MEEKSFLELLVSKENISGAWALFGALATLLGIFFNNLYENARRRKERQQSLVRDAYFGALNYISYCNKALISIIKIDELSLDKEVATAFSDNYKIFLIASPKVIQSFSALSGEYNKHFSALAELVLELKVSKQKQVDCETGRDNRLKSMEKINADKQSYKKDGTLNPELNAFLDASFETAEKEFEDYLSGAEKYLKENTLLQIKLLKEIQQAQAALQPYLNETLMVMRFDLEHSLSKKEMRQIEKSLALMQKRTQSDIQKFIEQIQIRITEIEEYYNAKE